MVLVAAIAAALIVGLLGVIGGTLRRADDAPSPSMLRALPPPSLQGPTLVASPSPTPTTEPPASASVPACRSSWSSTGTVDPRGKVDGIRVVHLDGTERQLLMVFGHPIDTVRSISITRTQPMFRDADGTRVGVPGKAFFELRIRGLTQPTSLAPWTVTSPITALVRVQKPAVRSPLDGPSTDSTEVWIIGLEYPSCLSVRTLVDDGYGGDASGPNALVVEFLRTLPPAPSA